MRPMRTTTSSKPSEAAQKSPMHTWALYSELGRIEDLHVSLAIHNTAAILSFSVTLFGLLSALVGSGIWARRAPFLLVLGLGALEGIIAFLLAVIVDINNHGPTAILIMVVFAGAIGCVVILSTAVSRFGL